jgi:FKBP-type peptidyl-prolyl cis-trans isomerase FklB
MKYKSLLLAACMSFATLISCNGQKGKTNVALKTQADSVAYGIGVSIGQNMKKDGLDSLDMELLMAGLKAAAHGDSTMLNQQQAQGVIQGYLNAKQKAKADAALGVGKKFLEDNKKKPGVTELPDGLQYQVMKEGTGAMPKETDTVSVHYHGTLIDGTIFDSSVERGQPAEFPLNGVIKGWTEALQLMKVGSKWKLFLPPSLAYGDRAAGPKIPANSTLIFEVELLGIKGQK